MLGDHHMGGLIMYHYTACGLDNIYLKNGYQKNSSPSGEGISIHDMDGLHMAIAKGLVNMEAPLQAKEFRFLRIELDLSQKALGNLLDKSDQIIAMWEKGTQAIPVLADKAIRDLYMESIGEGAVAGILNKLAELDRQYHELVLNLVETGEGWDVEIQAA
ncbi:hypothetical protein NX722_28470 [Endozoicomonas gorgoniicola]|uniref:Transcriptional regulator n=1 Tax=Endozoicomonas gorgoniicola TaxID=1234144 RepID=A0ABT3N4E6_9GAMM|nr:hypothetical protein [Endozoicomonas gorgoniicola]MCW7556502.1 hypothetical protein [Endozoicomonas gorgoniicola]